MDNKDDWSDSVLEPYRRWLWKVAWQYANDYHTVDDLAQEGWIAMWRASRSYKADCGVPLSVHLKMRAVWRILAVLKQGNWTGIESRQGRKHVAGTKRNRAVEKSTDMSVSAHDVEFHTYSDLDLAYHYGEIAVAINSLPLKQRQRVYNRFWRGDYDPANSAWWYAKRIGARDRLAQRLAHLAPDFGGRAPVPEDRPHRSYRRAPEPSVVLSAYECAEGTAGARIATAAQALGVPTHTFRDWLYKVRDSGEKSEVLPSVRSVMPPPADVLAIFAGSATRKEAAKKLGVSLRTAYTWLEKSREAIAGGLDSKQ